jgi:hypothetical protein
MARHVHIRPIHERKRAHANEIVRKLEDRLGKRATPTPDGSHRFELDDDDPGDLSDALDEVAPQWRDHVEMGL